MNRYRLHQTKDPIHWPEVGEIWKKKPNDYWNGRIGLHPVIKIQQQFFDPMFGDMVNISNDKDEHAKGVVRLPLYALMEIYEPIQI